MNININKILNLKNKDLINDLIKYPFIIFIIYLLLFFTGHRKYYRLFAKVFLYLILSIFLFHLFNTKILKLK